MATLHRLLLLFLLAVLAGPTALYAQQLRADQRESRFYTAERDLIESTIQTIVAVIQEVTLHHEDSGFGDRLGDITSQLTRATRMMPQEPNAAASVAVDDLDELAEQLRAIARRMSDLRDELEDDGSYELADRLTPIHRDLRDAARTAERLAEAARDEDRVDARDGERWLRPGRYGDDARDDDWRDRDEERQNRDDDWRDRDDEDEWAEDDRRDRDDEDDEDDDWWRQRSRGWWNGTYVGEYAYRWPYRNETALYTTTPDIRYNRVEGLVLGIGRRPLQWNDYDRTRIYGQLGYAFAMKDVRGEAGLELRLDRSRRDDYGLKVGGAYRYNTATADDWKVSWTENSLAAFFFENDFFDYYQVEGWTVYAVQRLTPYLQLSAGFRQDDYESLSKETGWSLFDGDGFRFNPPADEGRMQSFVFALEGGRVTGLHHLPRGGAFRFEAEIGDGVGGDFTFNRYVGDVRGYLPVTTFSSLGLRLRGGVTTGDTAPLQKRFTLGGLGTVRAYPQNTFPGSRMLLANAEYVVDDVDVIFDNWQLIGFFDAGWVNTPETNAFDLDDVFPAAGLGLGFDRDVRLELAWPLRDFGDGRDPSLWLRITPNF